MMPGLVSREMISDLVRIMTAKKLTTKYTKHTKGLKNERRLQEQDFSKTTTLAEKYLISLFPFVYFVCFVVCCFVHDLVNIRGSRFFVFRFSLDNRILDFVIL